MFDCEHCKTKLTSIKILKEHQKRAKYCLKIQEDKIMKICEGCDKQYSTKYNLNRHYDRCLDYHKIKYEQKLKEKDETIKELASQPRTINNTTNNNITFNIVNINEANDDLRNIIENLSAENIASPEYLASKIFALGLKDKVFYKDLSRNILTYAKDNEIVIDKGGRKLSNYIFSENIKLFKKKLENEIISSEAKHFNKYKTNTKIDTDMYVSKIEKLQKTLRSMEKVSKFELTDETIDYIVKFISEGVRHIGKAPLSMIILTDGNDDIRVVELESGDDITEELTEESKDFLKNNSIPMNQYIFSSDHSSSDEDFETLFFNKKISATIVEDEVEEEVEEVSYDGPTIEPVTEGIIRDCIKSYNKKGKRYITTLSSLIILFSKDLKRFIYYDTEKSCLVWKDKQGKIVYDNDSSQLFEFIFSSFYNDIKTILIDQLENPDLEEDYDDINSLKKTVKKIKKGGYDCKPLLEILRRTISKKEYFKGF